MDNTVGLNAERDVGCFRMSCKIFIDCGNFNIFRGSTEPSLAQNQIFPFPIVDLSNRGHS